jgi:hypothetical protein
MDCTARGAVCAYVTGFRFPSEFLGDGNGNGNARRGPASQQSEKQPPPEEPRTKRVSEFLLPPFCVAG